MLPKGLKPSAARPILTLRGSCANQGYNLSKSFHASSSGGCLKIPSLATLFSWCHFISHVVCLDINNLRNIGFKEK